MMSPATTPEDDQDDTPIKLHRPHIVEGVCTICRGSLHERQHHGTWYRCLHQYEGSGQPCEHGCNSVGGSP